MPVYQNEADGHLSVQLFYFISRYQLFQRPLGEVLLQ